MASPGGTLAPPAEAPGADAPTNSPVGWFRFVLAVGVLAGVALRVWFLVSPAAGSVDSDEAIVGLMAVHALEDGELRAFFWGQHYGGTFEALLAVPVFAVFGVSALTLKLVPITLSAVAAVLVWRLGLRTVGSRAGAVAAVAVWVWPANMVWFSTKERGFYWVCLVAGLAILVVVARLVDDPRPLRWWAALGLLGGLGWWSSPQILYFAVPGTIWLLVRVRGDAWRLAVSAPVAMVAAGPWLANNLSEGWLSLESGSRAFDQGIVGNIRVLLNEGVPVILGLWFAPGRPLTFPVLYLAVGVIVVVGVARRRAGTGLLVLGALVFPLVYAFFPVSGVVGEGRYVLFLLPFLALLIAHGAGNRAAQSAFLAVALTLSVVTAPRFEGRTLPYAGGVKVPADVDPLIDELRRRDISHIVADYWVSYRVVFESGREVIASPLGQDRYPAYTRAVLASEQPPAWVFVDGAGLAGVFEEELAFRGIGYERFAVGGFTVFRPEVPVLCWPVTPEGFPCEASG